MATYNEIYVTTKATKKNKNLISKFKACKYQKLVIKINPLAGKIKKFVAENAIEYKEIGWDYNGYGWANHDHCYLLTPAKAKELLAMIEEKKAAKAEKKEIQPEEPEYSDDRMNWTEWQLLIEEIEAHNRKYVEIPTVVRNDFQQRNIQTPAWSKKQINELGDKITASNDYDELWNCWMALCKLNASAHKGYRYLTWQQEDYNRIVYRHKELFVKKLAEKWAVNGGLLQYHAGVLYITNTNGWQISFHRAPYEAIAKAEHTYQDIWSHIICSWSYSNASEYKEAAAEWKQKQDIEETTKDAYQTYVSDSKALKRKIVRLLLNDGKIRRFYAKKGYYRAIMDTTTKDIDYGLTKSFDYLIGRFTHLTVA